MSFRANAVKVLKELGVIKNANDGRKVINAVLSELVNTVLKEGSVGVYGIFSIKVKWKKPYFLNNLKTGGKTIKIDGHPYLSIRWSRYVKGLVHTMWPEEAIEEYRERRRKRRKRHELQRKCDSGNGASAQD